MPYPKFTRSRLSILPLDQRIHDLKLDDFVLPLNAPVPAFDDPNLPELARRIAAARRNDRPVILMMGAHVIRKGMSRLIIDLMERGLVADFSLIKGRAADPHGNVVYNKTARNFAPLMATAGKVTIVQVGEIVPLGGIDPECVVTPGIFVNRVVEVREPLQESALVAAGVSYP